MSYTKQLEQKAQKVSDLNCQLHRFDNLIAQCKKQNSIEFRIGDGQYYFSDSSGTGDHAQRLIGSLRIILETHRLKIEEELEELLK